MPETSRNYQSPLPNLTEKSSLTLIPLTSLTPTINSEVSFSHTSLSGALKGTNQEIRHKQHPSILPENFFINRDGAWTEPTQYSLPKTEVPGDGLKQDRCSEA